MNLQTTVGNVEVLPALPRVYNEVTAALADPEVSLEVVADIVEQDAAICAKILQLVNSSFFGVARSIADVRQATTYLGLTMLRNLVLSAEVFRSFKSSGSAKGFSIEKEQTHSTLTARIARHLLDDKIMSENAFMAAMLHDIGKLIVATELPGVYESVAAASETGDGFHYVSEEKINGISHAEIGAYLLGIWGMPYPIVEAVANHHHPSRVDHDEFDTLGAVHVADVLAREQAQAAEEPPEGPPDRLDVDYLEAKGLMDRLPEWREIASQEAEAEHARAA